MTRLLIFLLCCISTIFLSQVQGKHVSEGLKITLKHGGSLIGRHMESAHGRYINGYLGIPYAKPPVGELRFRAPLPADAWQGEKMATTDGNVCSQVDTLTGSQIYSGDEDCLYLNVYVPQEPKTREPLPVMVWIPGGGFVAGDGTSKSYDPKRLLDRDIILVSMNYRLSTLGFLSSETLDIPGNFALKDQLMALKWVKEHISSFGGDENSITLFGESAGGVSVAYHTLSEKSKGLFHKAISSSGTFYNSWGKPVPKGSAASMARRIAEYVGCGVDQESWGKTLTCLRTIPARNLTEASKILLIWDYVPLPILPLVIEPEHEDAFITHPPQVTAYSNSMPLMIGFNKDEGMMFLLLHFAYIFSFQRFTRDLDTYFPYALTSPYISKEYQAYTKQAILDFYFGNGPITKSQNLTDAFTDSFFLSGIDEHVRHRLSTEYPAAPTYLYQFQHKGELSNSYILSNEFQGVCHGDDLFYLFPSGEQSFPTSIPSKRDQEVSENMIDLWYNFAAVGDPSPANTYLPRWSPITSYPPKIMHIGSLNNDDSLLELTDDYPEGRASFWRKLQPYLQAESQKIREYAFYK